MSYVQPDGKLRILAKVPLDTTYDHTIYWNTTPGGGGVTAQRDYFLSKTKGYGTAAVSKYTLDAQSYQRVKRGYLRVGIQADDLYDCNYLMFQNTHFGAKWFYAFIKSVEYINNEVSEIEYEVDVMQTWHFEYEPEECFVEREHTATDVIGENTVPENLEIGDYMYESLGKMWGNMDAWSIIVAATFELGQKVVEGITKYWDVLGDAYPGFYNRYFTGIHFNEIPAIDTNIQDFYDTMHSLFNASKIDEIVGIFMMPTNIVSTKSSSMQQVPTEITKTITKQTAWNYGSPVKNNKLYTYPFNVLYITSSDGNSAVYRYEYFSSNNCVFSCECAMGIPPECSLIPKDYCFSGNTTDLKNYNFALSLKNFPLCSWANDAFMAWLAQTSTSLLGTLGAGAVAAAIAPETLPVVAENVGGAVAGSIGGLGKALLMPDYAKGVNKNVISVGDNEFGYHFYNARIKDEFARIIDDYFTRFGYAVKRNKKPNRNARPHWTYCKTLGCTITASIPAPDAKAICNIYNNGITFWKNGDEIGRYSEFDNSPVTPTPSTPTPSTPTP